MIVIEISGVSPMPPQGPRPMTACTGSGGSAGAQPEHQIRFQTCLCPRDTRVRWPGFDFERHLELCGARHRYPYQRFGLVTTGCPSRLDPAHKERGNGLRDRLDRLTPSHARPPRTSDDPCHGSRSTRSRTGRTTSRGPTTTKFSSRACTQTQTSIGAPNASLSWPISRVRP